MIIPLHVYYIYIHLNDAYERDKLFVQRYDIQALNPDDLEHIFVQRLETMLMAGADRNEQYVHLP